jgi:hypothetical protein
LDNDPSPPLEGVTPDDEHGPLCAHCSEPITADTPETINAYASPVHVACVPPAPPCPDGIDPELWADGARTLLRAPRESDANYVFRLEIFAKLFAPAFERRKAATQEVTQ